MLTGAKSSVVETCASEDRMIGERRTVGSVSICASSSEFSDVFGTAKDVSECSRS